MKAVLHVGNKGEELGEKIHFEAVFRAAAQDSELSGGPTPGVQLPTAMVLAAFPYGRTHEIPCFFGGVLIFMYFSKRNFPPKVSFKFPT